jgi:hypothetical protein
LDHADLAEVMKHRPMSSSGADEGDRPADAEGDGAERHAGEAGDRTAPGIA